MIGRPGKGCQTRTSVREPARRGPRSARLARLISIPPGSIAELPCGAPVAVLWFAPSTARAAVPPRPNQGLREDVFAPSRARSTPRHRLILERPGPSGVGPAPSISNP
jgi:hypothetical protein